MKIVNLTQHVASREQIEAGVFDLPPVEREALQKLLTFEELPSEYEIKKRARQVAALVPRDTAMALIGGAPFLMSALENALIKEEVIPLYAFSVRESKEETLPDGSVRKINVFRHQGFVSTL